MPKTRFVVACSSLHLLMASAAAAQFPIQTVEVAGAYYAFAGEDLDGLESAPRVQVSVYGATRLALVGVTGTWGRGGIEGFDESFEEVGLGLALRRSFGTPGSLGGFLGVHLGWTRLSVELDPGVEENGFTLGVSGGPELDVGGVRVFLGGEVLWQTMGDIRLIEGAPIGTGGDQGWRLGGKLGILLGRIS
jgi:hypothetical protein